MKKSLFISSIIIYLCVFICKQSGFYLPELVNAYLSDILCLPIVLSIARYVSAYWINDACFSLSIAQITLATINTIIIFEVVLPHNSGVYTADWLDGVMYALGAILYCVLQTPIVHPPKTWFKSY